MKDKKNKIVFRTKVQAISTINKLGKGGHPFFFLTDYKNDNTLVCPLDQIPNDLTYNLLGVYTNDCIKVKHPNLQMSTSPISFSDYLQAFSIVKKGIHAGNSYLCNLTFPTPITCKHSLEDIYYSTTAKYKLWLNNQFVVFSPETFVEIKDGFIYTHPMKGTIDADIPNAKDKLLHDPKEKAEHATIVDLLRNDLSRISTEVCVSRYRYFEKITSPTKNLWQTSSEIRGRLPVNYKENLGNILFDLLPAGSISGAPKAATQQIIAHAEKDDRGFYTGVFGVFDGQNLHSAVAIRFIEQTPNGLLYRSGGGITAMSNAQEEYNELIDKIYFPSPQKVLANEHA